MPALNFQKQFADLVEKGIKKQTIRAYRKRPFKIGDKLYLYTGMRTKKCKNLGEVKCKGVYHFRINEFGLFFINGKLLMGKDQFLFALQDGFSSTLEMIDWFDKNHGLPFKGQLIIW